MGRQIDIRHTKDSSMNTSRTIILQSAKQSKTKDKKLDYSTYWKIVWRSITPIKPKVISKV